MAPVVRASAKLPLIKTRCL